MCIIIDRSENLNKISIAYKNRVSSIVVYVYTTVDGYTGKSCIAVTPKKRSSRESHI